MLSSLIHRYKSLRKHQYLNRLVGYKYNYAFIGAGQHSLYHLYPILRQLNVPLRYVCTRTAATAQKVATSFSSCSSTTNIDTILQDETIRGVFVCTQAQLHHDIISRLLKAGKAVFVDKPPTFSGTGLEELITANKGIPGANASSSPSRPESSGTAARSSQPVVVGLQRRFSIIRQLLQKQKLSTATYHYQYLTGPYPEGNPVYELFIHPIDFALQVFGTGDVQHIISNISGNLKSFSVHLEHANGASGIIQLSTAGSWSAISEMMQINTEKQTIEARYPFHLSATEKPSTIAGIPLDKVLPQPLIRKIYLDNQGTVPSLANNSLVAQGFYGEIEHFLQLVEAGSSSSQGSLESLRPTYKILDSLNAAGVR